jgi:uncharacterized coiled-coil protein SlyX
MTTPTEAALEALERRIAELEADLSLINSVIKHLERAVLNKPRENE